MKKKHYEAIANIIKTKRESDARDEWYDEVKALASYFEQDNKNFNREMFLTACGID